MGRPTKFKPEYIKQARKLCVLGATDKNLADFFEVSEDTINEWKKVYPLFSESLNEGKQETDARVEKALLKRAEGYKRTIERLDKEGTPVKCEEELPPDPTSMIFWLKNRKPKEWRDKQEVNHEGGISITFDTPLQLNDQPEED